MRASFRVQFLVAFIVALVLAVPVSEPAAQSRTYEQGLRAFRAGEMSEALRIWRELAEQGDTASQYGVGVVLERGGDGVQQDLAAAAEWYQRAADQGLPAAQNNLGLLYARGRGVPQDPVRAAAMWESAAKEDHPMAQYNLGLAFYRGTGVEKDRTRAHQWFRRAAQSGLTDAQFALAQLYRLGVGVEKDSGRALAWYERAAEGGHADAARYAAELQASGAEAAELEPAGGTAVTRPAGGADTDAGAAPAKAPVKSVDAEPKPEPEPESQTAGTPPVDAVVPSGSGNFFSWIASTRSADAAEVFWKKTVASAPGLKELDMTVVKLRIGDAGTFFRVMAGPVETPDRALAICRAYRQGRGESDAFCKVLQKQG